MAQRIDALIVSNTSISRPHLKSKHHGETGGLSGAPLKGLALQRLKNFRMAAGPSLPLIAAAGIENGVDASDRIRAGARLIQIYSALVYQGPGLARSTAAVLQPPPRSAGLAHLHDARTAEP